jgi:hypothetical protein
VPSFAPAVGVTQTKEANMSKKTTNRTKRKYRVTYAVTRGETYEILAWSPQHAEQIAFENGEEIKSEASSFDCVDVEEVQ